MAGTSSFFAASGGWRLNIESWQPPVPAKAAVLFLHGVNESSETLTARRLADACTAAGASFHVLEQHGHGMSLERDQRAQPMGLVEGFDLLVKHAVEACVEVARSAGGAPVALLGHSMGAAVAACAAKEAAAALAKDGSALLTGAFIAPPVEVEDAATGLLLGALRALARLLPQLPVGPPEHPEEYCPLDVAPPGRNYAGRMRARTALVFCDLGAGGFWERLQPGDLGQLPFLVLWGTADGTVARGGCERLAAAGPGGELMLLEGGSHQPVACDDAWQDTVARLVAWLRQRWDAAPRPGPAQP